MKAAILKNPPNIEIFEIKKPKIGMRDVLIRVIEAGVCSSYLHTYQGVHPFRKPPAILGHEVAGIVQNINNKRFNKRAS